MPSAVVRRRVRDSGVPVEEFPYESDACAAHLNGSTPLGAVTRWSPVAWCRTVRFGCQVRVLRVGTVDSRCRRGGGSARWSRAGRRPGAADRRRCRGRVGRRWCGSVPRSRCDAGFGRRRAGCASRAPGHRCQLKFCRVLRMAAFRPAWASEMTSFDPPSPRSLRSRRNLGSAARRPISQEGMAITVSGLSARSGGPEGRWPARRRSAGRE